jgi:uncharacterized membrane protein YeiB
LAVFGMYAAHLGPDPAARGGVTGHLMELAHGRASALFALLAGVTLVIIAGRRTPKTGRDGRQAAAKIAIRAVVLFVLGTALTMTGTPVEVILAYYGLYFLLALPLARLRAPVLAALAVGWALIGPQVLYKINEALSVVGTGDAVDPRNGVGPEGIMALLFTGTYPALSWMPFVIAGMALGRLDLAAATVRVRLAVLGPALAAVGYGGSWLALHLIPGVQEAIAESAMGDASSVWWSDTAGFPSGSEPAWLWAASPHSETTLSIIGNSGVAITVIVAALAAMDHLPRLRRLAAPLIAVGTMSLTAYVFHIVGIGLLGIEMIPGSSLTTLGGFLLAVTAAAFAWSRFFTRGPLEYLTNAMTGVARRIR